MEHEEYDSLSLRNGGLLGGLNTKHNGEFGVKFCHLYYEHGEDWQMVSTTQFSRCCSVEKSCCVVVGMHFREFIDVL